MSKDEMSIHMLRKFVIDGFLICGLLTGIVAIVNFWSPFQRGFFCGDESLMFPYKSDTVPTYLLRLYCFSLPLLAFLVCEWALLRKQSGDVRCLGVRIPTWLRGFYCAAVSFALGVCFTELVTNVTKNVIGRPRPFFFAVCKPSVNCSAPEWQGRYIQSEDYHCTGDQIHSFKDMRMSFLSGHSSLSAYCMIFLALYLEKRMVWRGTRVLRHVLQFTAVMLSWFTALSRVSDFKHHWSDVLAGYMMGIAIAVLMWTWGTDLIRTKQEHIPVPQKEEHPANDTQLSPQTA